MGPDSEVTFSEKEFDRLKKTVGGISRAKRNPGAHSPIPLDIGIELTSRCNLRCKHCFLWNGEGLYERSEHMKPSDLDIEIVKDVLAATTSEKSKLFFWGTEPLIYRHWDALADLLEKDNRWTVICTNGMLIPRRLDSLLRISENLAIVVSLDGLEAQHDEMRGKESFKQIISNIEHLLALQKKGVYKGTVSVHCVLNDVLIDDLYEFCLYIESLNIDSLYLGFPWYISPQSAKNMDEFYQKELSFIARDEKNSPFITNEKQLKSWHTYTFHLDPEKIPTLKAQINKIKAKTWKMRFRFQPSVDMEDIEDYVLGSEKPMQNKTKCHALSNRIDIRSNGIVTACQPFPDLVMGDLYKDDILSIWNGEKFNQMRKTIHQGLSPICSRCILLYLNGS